METPTQILNLIAKGYLSKQIASELKVSPAAISQRLRTLEKKGLIHIQKKGIILEISLTAKGLAELNSVGVSQDAQPNPQKPRRATREPLPTLNSAPSKRLHALGLKYPLIEPLKPSEPILLLNEQRDIEYTPITLTNNTQAVIHADITIKLTTNSLILFAPALYYSRGQPSIVPEAQAKKMLDRIAIEYEQRLNIRLKRFKKDVLYSERITEESADERHPLAQQAPPKHKTVLARAPDGKERLEIDNSKRNFPELETVYHRTAGEDADVIDKQFNAILDGKLNLLDMDYYIKALTADLAQDHAERLEMRQMDLALRKDIKKHLDRLDAEMAKIYKGKTRELLSQRRLNDYKVD